MGHRAFAALLVIAASLCGFQPSQAATGYVSDQLEISLRAGEGVRYKILRMLPSGTHLDVLGANAKSGYSRVRTPEGTVGFVLTREIQTDPVARMQIEEMKGRLDALLKEPESLAGQLANLRVDHEQLTQKAETLKGENAKLSQELADIRAASTRVVEIKSENERLEAEAERLSHERDDLFTQNENLKNNVQQRWFLIGAGVTLGGIILGLILPSLRSRKRKTSWNTL